MPATARSTVGRAGLLTALLLVAACAARALRTVVVTLAALERVRPTLDALTAAGLTVEAVQLQASRLSPLPGDAHRLAATNPVFVLWGHRGTEPAIRTRISRPRPRTERLRSIE